MIHYLQVLPLFVKDNDLVPLVRHQPHRLERVLLDELHPAVLVPHPGEKLTLPPLRFPHPGEKFTLPPLLLPDFGEK